MGDIYLVDGMKTPVPMGLIAAAGIAPKDIRIGGAKFEDLHRGGWDASARLADQDRDGVGAEIIYPTVGMLICNHPDFDYKKACFDAYNRWLQAYCSHAPDRIVGMGQIGIATKTQIKPKKPSQYKVLLLNDDYTPMEFVVHVLERFFQKNREEATRIMLHVHRRGVGVCGTFTYEIAETKVTQVMDLARQNQHPLQCTIEKD